MTTNHTTTEARTMTTSAPMTRAAGDVLRQALDTRPDLPGRYGGWEHELTSCGDDRKSRFSYFNHPTGIILSVVLLDGELWQVETY